MKLASEMRWCYGIFCYDFRSSKLDSDRNAQSYSEKQKANNQRPMLCVINCGSGFPNIGNGKRRSRNSMAQVKNHVRIHRMPDNITLPQQGQIDPSILDTQRWGSLKATQMRARPSRTSWTSASRALWERMFWLWLLLSQPRIHCEHEQIPWRPKSQ